jgi:hypothetical protein
LRLPGYIQYWTLEKGSSFPLRHGGLDTQIAEFFVVWDDIGVVGCTFLTASRESLPLRIWIRTDYEIKEILLQGIRHGGEIVAETAVLIRLICMWYRSIGTIHIFLGVTFSIDKIETGGENTEILGVK